MHTLAERLTRVTESLLDATRPAYSLRGDVLELKAIFEEAGGKTFGDVGSISTGETITDGGVAISPTMASMCVDDFARTVQFLRGIRDAIRASCKKSTKRPVRILYAGCGPWATLAIPLMTVFRPDESVFTLVDIHHESIDTAKQTINALGLGDSVESFAVEDVLHFQISDGSPPNVIVIEMLRAALEGEPQFAATANLVLQAPSAILVPQSVDIELALVNRASEFSFADVEQVGDPPTRDRVSLRPVLNLTKSLVLALVQSGRPLPTLVTPVDLPSFDPCIYTPMLLTTIRVYGDHMLLDYDSGLTCPRALPPEAGPGARIDITYETGERPGYRVSRNLVRR